jgi:Protein kinase domain
VSLAVPGLEQLEVVGRGGSGVVHRAWQPEFGRWVAVKVFPPDEDARRLERERIAVGRLSDHPGIVPVLGGGVTGDGRPYLVMSYMDGGSLADRVAARGVLTPAELVPFGTAMAGALQAAHDSGVWHRDLKPANILYDRYGRPRLADFGIAHVGDDAFRTETGRLSGTAAYLAPELLAGRPFTAASDVFSLGATLYYALEGRHLFEPRAEEPYPAFLVRRITTPQVPVFSPGVPQWLQDVVRAATELRPEDRLPTAAALAEALDRGPAGLPEPVSRPLPAYGTPPPEPGTRPSAPVAVRTPAPAPAGAPRRDLARWRHVVVGVAVTAVLVAGAWVWASSPSGRRLEATAEQPSGAPAGPGSARPATTAPATASATGRSARPTVVPRRTASTGPAAGPGAGPQDDPTDAATGAAAVRKAVEAFRRTAGGGDPLAQGLVFYPFPRPGGAAYAIATLPQPDRPALVDRYTFRDGTVGPPEPVPATGGAGARTQWHLDDVTWSAIPAMLAGTERVCRAAMVKAGLPDEPDSSGGRSGITHVIVERDVVFNRGAIVVRVYFGGGPRWPGGYVPFGADGKLLTTRYCSAS